jgi:hypothetical protein
MSGALKLLIGLIVGIPVVVGGAIWLTTPPSLDECLIGSWTRVEDRNPQINFVETLTFNDNGTYTDHSAYGDGSSSTESGDYRVTTKKFAGGQGVDMRDTAHTTRLAKPTFTWHTRWLTCEGDTLTYKWVLEIPGETPALFGPYTSTRV